MNKTAKRASLRRLVKYGVKYSTNKRIIVIKRYADYFQRLV